MIILSYTIKKATYLKIHFYFQCAELWSSDLGIYWKQFLGNYSPSIMCEMVGCEEEYYPDYPEFPSKASDLPSKERNRT